MRVVNKLAAPGDIRRIDLNPDTIRVVMSNGQERYYRASTTLTVECAYCHKQMGSKDGGGVSGVSHTICKDCWISRGYPGEYPGEET